MPRRFMLAIIAALVWSAGAFDDARANEGKQQHQATPKGGGPKSEGGHGGGGGKHGRARSVPELDPLAAGAIAAVLAGGGMLAARRRKQS